MYEATSSRQKVLHGRIVWGVLIAAVLIGTVFCLLVEHVLLSEKRALAQEMAAQEAGRIDRQLNRALSATYTLAALVRMGGGEIHDFETVAAELLPQYPGVSALQLAPAGVIRQTVPLVGNEAALGHDLLKDERRNKEARLAVETGALTLAGPFRLIQGGEAVVGRLPVYLGDGAERRFWGFVNSLVRVEDFLAASALDDMARQGYAYALWRMHPDSGERQVFAAAGGDIGDTPALSDIPVPNGRWFIGLRPLNGWYDWPRLILEAAAVLVLAILLSRACAWYLRTQRTLVANEARYRNLYENTPAMMHSINEQGQIVCVSQAWLETLGYRREEVIGRKSIDFLSEDSRRHAIETVLPEFFRTGFCRDIPYQLLARDGRVVDVQLSAFGERDVDGVIVRSLAVMQDVTERRRAERRVNDLLAEQRAIIENDLVGIVRVRGRQILWANPAFAHMLGYEPEELTGRPTRANYPDDASYQAFGDEAYPVLSAGQVFHSQLQQRHRDGRLVWLNVSGAMLDSETGESLWAFVDVTELKEALGRLAKSEQRMDLALAGADLGLWDWHVPSGRFACNPRMNEILGYTASELTLDNERYGSLIHIGDLPRVRATLFRHFRGELPMFEAEYRIRHKDERWIWVLCRGKVVERDARGRVVRMTGTNLDISDRHAVEQALRLREARLSNLIAAMQDVVVVFDAGGVIVEYFAPPAANHLPGQARPAPGDDFLASLPADVTGVFLEAMGRVLSDGHPETLEYVVQHAEARVFAQATISPILGGEATYPTGFLAVIRDVSRERNYQQQIETLSRRNALLLGSVGEGIYGIGLDGRTSFVNDAALGMLGFREAELLGQSSHTLFHHHREAGEQYPETDCPVFLTLRDAQQRHADSEWFWRKDGSGFPVSLTVSPILEGSQTLGAVVVFRDISERRRSEDEIRRLAYYDPLTGLPNRRLLLERLARAMVVSERQRRHGALLFIDLDHFKQLNDSLGHDAGDELLQQVASRLLAAARLSDTVARFGGDEFVLLLEGLGASADEARAQLGRIGEKLLQVLRQPYTLARGDYRSTPSIGMTLFLGTATQLENLLKEADIAMYRAKADGRDGFRLHPVP